VYANAWMTVREDVVRRLDGSEGLYGVVEKPDFALVLPRGDGGFWMVEQFRYPIGRRSWEFPMGSWPSRHEGTPLELARAELAEETGLTARVWRHVGRLAPASGVLTNEFDVFLATGLAEGDPSREGTEQDMTHRFVLDDEVTDLIRSGGLVDAASVAALALFYLLERDWPDRSAGTTCR